MQQIQRGRAGFDGDALSEPVHDPADNCSKRGIRPLLAGTNLRAAAPDRGSQNLVLQGAGLKPDSLDGI